MDDKSDLRKKDIVTGVLLLIVAGAILVTAMSYPMTESYGGVRNVWYVSPALFPLVVASLLAALALLLVGNGVRYLIRHRPTSDAVAKPKNSGRSVPFVFVTLSLVAFVYLYVPVVDFWIATLLYLFLFTSHFFVRDTFPLVPSAVAYLLLGALLRVLGEMWPLEDTGAQYTRDALCTIAMVGLAVYAFVATRRVYKTTRPIRIVFLTALATATFLVLAFKFGVLIPMPREGFYCYYLDELYFLIKSLVA